MVEDKTITKEESPKVEKGKAGIMVTSTQTVDFPSLGWGIHQGEECELPVETSAQKIILANQNINIINK
jgi:hypothetical protein